MASTAHALPARRTTSTVPAKPTRTGRILLGEVLHSTTEGWIGQVEFMHLPGDRLMLNGPARQIRAIINWHRRRGLLLRTNDPQPSAPGMMVTLTFTPPVVRGRALPGRAPQVKPWSTRRKVVAFSAVAGTVIGVLVMALLWPLVAMCMAGVLLALAYLWHRSQARESERNRAHMNIGHYDNGPRC